MAETEKKDAIGETLLGKIKVINDFAMQRIDDKPAIGVSDYRRIEDDRVTEIVRTCREHGGKEAEAVLESLALPDSEDARIRNYKVIISETQIVQQTIDTIEHELRAKKKALHRLAYERFGSVCAEVGRLAETKSTTIDPELLSEISMWLATYADGRPAPLPDDVPF